MCTDVISITDNWKHTATIKKNIYMNSVPRSIRSSYFIHRCECDEQKDDEHP
ncbi:hypothetical protein V1477_011522 [Vespula maculifrons]|uniref:Uncharacterized protein n=1 Tax=Vespula maculifrons TaxID=7453 RepID=A0ABD2BZE7_VESMC